MNRKPEPTPQLLQTGLWGLVWKHAGDPAPANPFEAREGTCWGYSLRKHAETRYLHFLLLVDKVGPTNERMKR